MSAHLDLIKKVRAMGCTLTYEADAFYVDAPRGYVFAADGNHVLICVYVNPHTGRANYASSARLLLADLEHGLIPCPHNCDVCLDSQSSIDYTGDVTGERVIKVYESDLAVQQADGRFKIVARSDDLEAQLRQLREEQ